MVRLSLLTLSALLFFHSTFSHAHHSRFGVFNTDAMIEIEAVITDIRWSNPHVQFEADVTGSDGAIQGWKIEATAVSMLRSRGLDRQFLHLGDRIKIAGYAANNNKPEMLAHNLLLNDGTEVLIDSSATPYFTNGGSGEILESIYDSSSVEIATANADGIFRVWSTVLTDPASFPMYKGGYPLNQAATKFKENWTPDPEQQLSCWSKDMPLLMITPHPIEFSQQGENILMRFEEDDAQRVIHMNDENKNRPLDGSSMGFSVGSWDDNTLVVETTNIDANAFDDRGTPISSDVRLVERFTLNNDEKRLDYRITVFDSQTFTEPFDSTRYWIWRPERAVQKWDCE